MSIEKKIYNGYAFSENEREKGAINYEIYQELKAKYKIKGVLSAPTEQDLLSYDFVYSIKVGYAHWDCTVYKFPKSMSISEQALIIDGGNLCFGFSERGNIINISTD